MQFKLFLTNNRPAQGFKIHTGIYLFILLLCCCTENQGQGKGDQSQRVSLKLPHWLEISLIVANCTSPVFISCSLQISQKQLNNISKESGKSHTAESVDVWIRPNNLPKAIDFYARAKIWTGDFLISFLAAKSFSSLPGSKYTKFNEACSKVCTKVQLYTPILCVFTYSVFIYFIHKLPFYPVGTQNSSHSSSLLHFTLRVCDWPIVT